MSETPSGLYDVFETPSGKFRRWHSTGSIECMVGGVWRSIPEVAQAEILRLRSALAARTEECARVANSKLPDAPDTDAWMLGFAAACMQIEEAIRALHSPPSAKDGGKG